VLPLVEEAFASAVLDDHAASRFEQMRERYATFIAREQARLAASADD
jgi:hypothetical protein